MPQPQTDVRRVQPSVWVQYKGERARKLQVAQAGEKESLKKTIIDEFYEDLQALSIGTIPMGDIRIVWGTGQVRGTYPLLNTVSQRADILIFSSYSS